MKPSDLKGLLRPPARTPQQIQLDTRIEQAVNRDKYLNREENWVKQETLHYLDPVRWCHPDVKESHRKYGGPGETDKQALRAQVNSVRKLFKDELTQKGWTVQGKYAPHRERIEAWHPNGAMVMVTIKIEDGTYLVKRYVLRGDVKPVWMSVSAAALMQHIANPRLQVPGKVAQLHCPCDKDKHPTEPEAVKALLERKLAKANVGSTGIAGTAYRCQFDDRVWHITKLSERRHWQNRGLWKEA